MAILLPMLQGGLGNLLFQLFGTLGISKHFGFHPTINLSFWKQATQHSTLNYFDTLLSPWKKFHKNIEPTKVMHEYKLRPIICETFNPNDIILWVAYFQNYIYFWHIRDSILSFLTFNTSVVERYPRLEESAFVHVRGGDYIGNPVHDINLSRYYENAIHTIDAPHYYIFTNDEAYFNSLTCFKNIQYTRVDENEIDSLYLMSRCKRGAICANSSFSWWGAFLNRDRTICMPSKWINDPSYYTDGLYFPGVTVLEV
jgi:hypothetical protein